MSAAALSSPSLVRGKLRADAPLQDSNWFRVGGPAELLFKPEDTDDLALFLQKTPSRTPVFVLGVGSNLIIGDGGIPGVVIRLGRGFTQMEVEGDRVRAGAGCLGRNLAWWCQEQGLSGLEFLSGIPGTVGGAVAMNAGAYGAEVKDVLVEVECVLRDGRIARFTPEELQMRYRKGNLPAGSVVVSALFHVKQSDKTEIARKIEEIATSREATQPVRERTGGSTFKNPEGHKAWQLIDAAGCRGLRLNEAQISEKHCNFMINTGSATAADLVALGEEVRARVQAHSGVTLEWEIYRIGTFL